jgi:hypothetical protein
LFNLSVAPESSEYKSKQQPAQIRMTRLHRQELGPILTALSLPNAAVRSFFYVRKIATIWPRLMPALLWNDQVQQAASVVLRH